MIIGWLRKVHPFALALGLATILAHSPAFSQRNLDDMFRRIRALSLAGNEDEALTEAERFESAVRARYGVNHPTYGAALNALAITLGRVGRYSEAEEVHRRVLAMRERTRDYRAIAETIGNLAVISYRRGKFAEAERLHKRELEIWEARPNDADAYGIPSLAGALTNLAVVYREEGRYEEAEGLYKRAQAINERKFGSNHPDIAINLGELTLLYLAQGRYQEAEPLAKRALAIREQDGARAASPIFHIRQTGWRSYTAHKPITRTRRFCSKGRWQFRSGYSVSSTSMLPIHLRTWHSPIRARVAIGKLKC
jgi:tetratricopeptide (TPR) repeat protein